MLEVIQDEAEANRDEAAGGSSLLDEILRDGARQMRAAALQGGEGRVPTGVDFPRGRYLLPAVLADVEPPMPIATGKVFGPAVNIMKRRGRPHRRDSIRWLQVLRS
jgi:acyl-CoA reductase-like NAD-dependent aldehyde dehydrogenase